MAKLVKAVFVKDPDRNRMVLLQPGEEPEPRLAALITNPGAWEDGELPDPEDDDSAKESKSAGDGKDARDAGDGEEKPKAAPAAKKTAAKKTAASHRSGGREAADMGDSGN
ncbi:hypothetical protein [Streptomyces sp. NPDC008092]|uniref:hypothetical protein n=1 Tax=Streptomyces sp. NPDC008092 TaxID=3364808 RepID=UPI0036E3C080